MPLGAGRGHPQTGFAGTGAPGNPCCRPARFREHRNLLPPASAVVRPYLVSLCRSHSLANSGLAFELEALLGSVSQHCVHHASCPVLIMRAEPGQSAS